VINISKCAEKRGIYSNQNSPDGKSPCKQYPAKGSSLVKIIDVDKSPQPENINKSSGE
jgi:hypothetical protein